jgi:hypothetical protein
MLDVRFGSKADICDAKAHVRFTPPIATLIAHFRMSALGQKRTHAVQQKGSLFDHRVVSRQPELEHGTFRYARQSPELPAVRLNDRSANG